MDFRRLVERIFHFVERIFRSEPIQRMSSVQMVQEAKSDWIYAKAYFDMVSDTDLVDYAVYMIMAAEKRYMYLLKCARQEGATEGIVYSLYTFNKRMTG